MRKVTSIGTLLLLTTAMVGATPRQTGETLSAISHSEGTHLQSSKRSPRETTTLVEVLRRLNREKGTYFLFSDASIGGFPVQAPNLKESTDKIIDELTRQAGLSFTKVSDNTFVIRGAKGTTMPEATSSASVPLSSNFIRMEDLRAEQIIINGKVLSAKDNTPLENVTVRIVGTKKGTTTRADGSYTITIDRGQSLEFSRVNMISRTVKSPDGRSEVIVLLQESENNLSEVVVVAYSNQKRSTFTG
ncbi:MAG: hypothetical protein RL151_1562, partial [Bacteroidota bacterium]